LAVTAQSVSSSLELLKDVLLAFLAPKEPTFSASRSPNNQHGLVQTGVVVATKSVLFLSFVSALETTVFPASGV